jgi:hypothetical protein
MGVSASTDTDVFAIVGGTGDFAMARGILTKKVHQRGVDTHIFELTVDGFCHMNVSILLYIQFRMLIGSNNSVTYT